jgi:hypothetical protein
VFFEVFGSCWPKALVKSSLLFEDSYPWPVSLKESAFHPGLCPIDIRVKMPDKKDRMKGG